MRPYLGMIALVLLLVACATTSFPRAQPVPVAPSPEEQPSPPLPSPPVIAPPVVVSPEESLGQQLVAAGYKGVPVFERATVSLRDPLSVRFDLLPNVGASQLYLRAVTLDTSLLIANTTTNYTTMRFTFWQTKYLCTAEIPKKTVMPVLTYRVKNPYAKDNPYLKAYWTSLAFNCTDGVPEVLS